MMHGWSGASGLPADIKGSTLAGVLVGVALIGGTAYALSRPAKRADSWAAHVQQSRTSVASISPR
jgi:hypothetical protein